MDDWEQSRIKSRQVAELHNLGRALRSVYKPVTRLDPVLSDLIREFREQPTSQRTGSKVVE